MGRCSKFSSAGSALFLSLKAAHFSIKGSVPERDLSKTVMDTAVLACRCSLLHRFYFYFICSRLVVFCLGGEEFMTPVAGFSYGHGNGEKRSLGAGTLGTGRGRTLWDDVGFKGRLT